MLQRKSKEAVGIWNRGGGLHILVTAVRITAQQIPALSRTLHLGLQDFPGPNSFSRTFQVLEILQTRFQDFPGGVGTLHMNVKKLETIQQSSTGRAGLKMTRSYDQSASWSNSDRMSFLTLSLAAYL